MSGVLQSADGTKSKISTHPRTTSSNQAVLIRVDQAIDRLTMLAQKLDSPLTKIPNTSFDDQAFASASPDGRRFYVASPLNSTLVGYHGERPDGQPQEFCRLRLGLQNGGISSVAVGGTWVFAACGEDNRVVVLRLCHDWYQNRTRLLVMRVVDGGQAPTSMVTNKHGSIVGVLYAGESLLRVYRCSVNGKLDLVHEHSVPGKSISLAFDEATSSISVKSPLDSDELLSHPTSPPENVMFGQSRLELESIFDEIQDLDMVRA